MLTYEASHLDREKPTLNLGVVSAGFTKLGP
jgi:hypothetical protein